MLTAGLEETHPSRKLKTLHACWVETLRGICSNPCFIDQDFLEDLAAHRLRLLDFEATTLDSYQMRTAIGRARLQAAKEQLYDGFIRKGRFWRDWNEMESLVHGLQFELRRGGGLPPTEARPWVHKNLTVWFADGTLSSQATMFSIDNFPVVPFQKASTMAHRYNEILRERNNALIRTIKSLGYKTKKDDKWMRMRIQLTRIAVKEIEKWQKLLAPRYLAVAEVPRWKC